MGPLGILIPALAEVAGEGALVTVTELDVDLECGQGGAGHVTEWTLHVIHCTEDHKEALLSTATKPVHIPGFPEKKFRCSL